MRISVKIKPGSKNQKINVVKDMFDNEIYEVSVKALPKDGEANKELIELLSEHFKTAKRNIEIKSGFTSRNKILSIKS